MYRVSHPEKKGNGAFLFLLGSLLAGVKSAAVVRVQAVQFEENVS